MSKRSFLLSSGKMAIATLTSRILGFYREILLAQIFGASGLTDAFNIAFKIPNMLRDLFAEGAFSSAFVPIFTGEKNKNLQEAKNLLWSMAIVLTILTGIISVLIFFFASDLVLLLTNEKFTNDAQRLETTVLLTKMMSPFLAFVSIAALFMGVLNTFKMFFAPAMAPAIFNVIMIISMLVFPKMLIARGLDSIISLGIGVLIGGFAQMVIQLPLIINKGLLSSSKIELLSPNVKEILKRMSIGTVGVAATQINLLITTFLATGTVVGAVSWLSYAFRLFQFPVGILGVSIGNSNLVHFSEAIKEDNYDEARKCLQTSYITSLFTLLPAGVLIFVLAKESVMIAFERGAFNANDTAMVELALKSYLVGLPFYGLYKVFSPSFYALDKPKIPVVLSSIGVLINIIFCVSLIDHFGFSILALGTSVTMIFIILSQSVIISRMLKLKLSFFFPLRFFKIFGAAIICYLATYYSKQHLIIAEEGLSKLLISFTIVAGLGAISYLVALCLLGDYKNVSKLLKRFKK